MARRDFVSTSGHMYARSINHLSAASSRCLSRAVQIAPIECGRMVHTCAYAARSQVRPAGSSESRLNAVESAHRLVGWLVGLLAVRMSTHSLSCPSCHPSRPASGSWCGGWQRRLCAGFDTRRLVWSGLGWAGSDGKRGVSSLLWGPGSTLSSSRRRGCRTLRYSWGREPSVHAPQPGPLFPALSQPKSAKFSQAFVPASYRR